MVSYFVDRCLINNPLIFSPSILFALTSPYSNTAFLIAESFIEFIKENDTDKNSNQQAVVEYHSWRLLSD